MGSEDECRTNCCFLRRARLLGFETLPELSTLNRRITTLFLQIFTPLSRDFPALQHALLQAIIIPVSGRTELLYYLKAWNILYQYTLKAARKQVSTPKHSTRRNEYD